METTVTCLRPGAMHGRNDAEYMHSQDH